MMREGWFAAVGHDSIVRQEKNTSARRCSSVYADTVMILGTD
jgi:hypothetical protein